MLVGLLHPLSESSILDRKLGALLPDAEISGDLGKRLAFRAAPVENFVLIIPTHVYASKREVRFTVTNRHRSVE